MSVSYQGIGWNPQKKRYDTILALLVVGYLLAFMTLTFLSNPDATIETVLIRAFGTCAFLLLHLILSIGPLCRLDRRFLPLLYNRRHLGVAMFVLGLTHATISIVQFHTLGELNPLVSVLAGVDDASRLPFQPLGFAALAIFFLMAATSHDFWLANLTAPVWKTLHMLVYPAYALLLLHVALGALQLEQRPILAGILLGGMGWIISLHVLAAVIERRRDRAVSAADGSAEFVEVCGFGEIAEDRARIVTLSGERVAVFRYGNKVSAISNVCKHQNGPLGEGKIVDGCVVCPWHGYQYLPASGASPPPFAEKIPTFDVEIRGDRVWVDPRPNAPGTHVEPAVFEGSQNEP